MGMTLSQSKSHSQNKILTNNRKNKGDCRKRFDAKCLQSKTGQVKTF